MTIFGPRRFEIDSALELVADAWSADVPDSTMFRTASLADRVSLSAGYVSGTGAPLTVASIVNGVIDEYEVTITPNSILGRVRGRDSAASILDSYYSRIYTRSPAATLNNAGYTDILPSVPASSLIENITVGDVTAAKIALDAVSSVGLSLNWGVRDYEIQTTYQVTGRIIDTLRRLVEPWSIVEPFKVDIYIQGTTVMIKPRQLPGQLLQADYTFALADARRGQLLLRKRRYKKLGKITLRGQKVPAGLTTAPTSGGGLVFVATNETHTTSSTVYDPGGNLVTTVVTTDTIRVPDRIPISSIKEVTTWGGPGGRITLSSRESLTYDVETSVYDFNGPINQPKIRSQSIVRESIDSDDNVFKVMSTESVNYKYDANNFLINQTTLKMKFDAETKKMQNNELTIENLRDVSALIAERITEVYSFVIDEKRWSLVRRDTSQGGGHRPGGPGRGGSVAGLEPGGGSTTFVNLTVTATLSTDADATNVEYLNENLSLDDLNFLLSLFQASVGLYEYELQFDGVAMPWLRRGMALQFTDVVSEDGVTLISLPPCVVTSVTSSYDESTPKTPSFIQRCRAFGIRSS